MSRTVWSILAILALAFAAITGLAVKRGILGPQTQSAAIGGPFHLTDQKGAPADASLLVVGVWIYGALALRDFGLALFVGLLTGAYSSIFVATPILAWLKEREPLLLYR